MVEYSRFGKVKRAHYTRYPGGPWGTYTGLSGEWVPVDSSGIIKRSRDGA